MDRRAIGIAVLFCALCQGQIDVPLTAFNAGELSPLMEGRADYAKYAQGLRRCENCLPLSQGPITRRPGTKYIATTNDSGEVRLIAFENSVEDAYVLEFGDLYMRVFRAGGQVLDGNDPYEIVTPFDSEEIPYLQVVQDADTMYIVDGNDPPQSLTRDAHTDWDINDVNFTTGPFLPLDSSGTTITPSDVNGTITLTASAALFDEGHVDSLWKLYHRRQDESVSGTLDANESSTTLEISGNYNVVTHGTWTATITLMRSYDAGVTWNAIDGGTVISSNDDNMNKSGVETEPDALYRLDMTDRTSGSATYTIRALDYLDYGIVKVTAYTDATHVTALVLDEIVDTNATSIWQEGYWSGYRGWPRTVALHEQRLWFGGSTDYPQTLWASQTAETEGDYQNMTTGTDADSALIFQLPGRNPIQWLYSQSYLMVGTAGGVGRLGSLDEGMTPTSHDYRMQTSVAAERIQPVAVGDVLLYVERGGLKLRQYLYSLDADQFIAPDVSLLASHICGDGLVGMTYQATPQPIIWTWREDGVVVSWTYLREQEVVAAARQVTDGVVESMVVIPGDPEEEVWWSVAREIDGSTVRYIEQVQPHDWGTDQNDCWYVDSGLSFDGGDPQTVTAVSKANPCVVTVSVWPTDGDGTDLADGDQVRFEDVMEGLNGEVFTVASANSTTKTFALKDETGAVDITSVGFGVFTSGGTVQRVENTFAGLDHLEGETLALWCDGGSVEGLAVDGGEIVLDGFYNRVLAGLPYTSTMETMPLLVQTQAGSNLRTPKRIVQIGVDFYETWGPVVGGDGVHTTAVVQEDTLSDTAPDLYTEWKEIGNIEGGWSRKPTVWIQQTIPAPMTIRQVEVEVKLK